MRFKAVSRLAAAVMLGLVPALAGCGSSSPHLIVSPTTSTTIPPTTLLTRPSTTDPAPLSTTPTRQPVTAIWVPVTANLAGLASECGDVSLVSVRPDRDMLTVSVALHGLWASENGSESWKPLGGGAGSATITNRASTIVYDPDHPNTFWESGIYNGGGVYRTDDNGVTFRQLGTVTHSDGVSVDLSDPQRLTLLSGVHEQPVVYVSHDGGRSWNDISGSLPKDAGFAAQPLALDSRTYLLGTYYAPGSGVFRTTDSGATWTAVYTGAVLGRPLVAKDGAIYWVTSTGAIIKSADRGVTWTNLTPAGFINQNSPFLVELPDGSIAALGRTVIISADHGATWRSIGPALPIPPTGLAYSGFRKAFYMWYFECGLGAIPVAANAIMRLDFDYTTQ